MLTFFSFYKAGSYTELVAVFTNVFLGMQIPLSVYLQVWFCITNDVIMSVSLMYES
jgi:sodium/potassium-transporting ATPase subunit alpha